jgi:hypothetical protein
MKRFIIIIVATYLSILAEGTFLYTTLFADISPQLVFIVLFATIFTQDEIKRGVIEVSIIAIVYGSFTGIGVGFVMLHNFIVYGFLRLVMRRMYLKNLYARVAWVGVTTFVSECIYALMLTARYHKLLYITDGLYYGVLTSLYTMVISSIMLMPLIDMLSKRKRNYSFALRNR